MLNASALTRVPWEDDMSSIWTNLLFMHGHITNLELARRLAEAPGPEVKPRGRRQAAPKQAKPARKGVRAPVMDEGGCLTG